MHWGKAPSGSTGKVLCLVIGALAALSTAFLALHHHV
jgi:hypothetical protein